NPEEEQLEARLKQFRPLAAEPMPVERAVPARRRRFVLAVCAAAAIAVVVVVLLKIQYERQVAPAPQHAVKQTAAATPANGRPLTIRSANELLARAPSVKSALDELAFRSRPKQLPRGKQSALAALGKEDFKL
ncbi:MAG TPA: hypothetical protein VFJ52_10030, partial [Terriglobia bacterium]|nr:hypothetical protein [Terriglobia bacterium]